MARYGVTAPVFLLLLAFTASSAQSGSPSSANGIGVIVDDNTGRSRGMGGAGMAIDDGWSLNRGNPALISSFKKPAYGIGFLYNRAVIKPQEGSSLMYARSDPTLIRFVLPIYRGVSMGWGLAPVSRTDVKIALPSDPGDISSDTVTSSGGVNLTSFELAGRYRAVRAGVALNYYFGVIEEDWARDFHGAPGMNNTVDYIKRKYRGYGLTLGALARVTRRISAGLGYTTPVSMNMSVHLWPENRADLDILVEKRKTDLPAAWRLGVAAELSRRLSAAADFAFSRWSNAARTEREKNMYTDTSSFGAGIRFIPSVSPTAGYLSTIPLSAGFRTGTLYYKSWPKTKRIRETAVTFGVEIPFKSGSGGLITSCELGKRGDANSNGWDETFVTVGISLVGMIK